MTETTKAKQVKTSSVYDVYRRKELDWYNPVNLTAGNPKLEEIDAFFMKV